MVCLTDGVTLKMIEDLRALIDNLSQEVALLKEKQALQTGKRLMDEGTVIAVRLVLFIMRTISLYELTSVFREILVHMD